MISRERVEAVLDRVRPFMGIKPAPVYLKPGDVVALGIDGLGESRQTVVGYATRS